MKRPKRIEIRRIWGNGAGIGLAEEERRLDREIINRIKVKVNEKDTEKDRVGGGGGGGVEFRYELCGNSYEKK